MFDFVDNGAMLSDTDHEVFMADAMYEMEVDNLMDMLNDLEEG